jgi:glutamyl-tRNA synthetase
MLGWNDGTDNEIFSLDELKEKFSIDRVSKAGAKFDFEKAKWYNAEWIKKSEAGSLKSEVVEVLAENGITVTDDNYLLKVIDAVKERCVLLGDFYQQSAYFFEVPKAYDENAVKPKWNEAKTDFFDVLMRKYADMQMWETVELENIFKQLMEEKSLKAGDVMLPFRIMLVGGKFGPHVFDIAALLGKDETISRIEKALVVFNQ